MADHGDKGTDASSIKPVSSLRSKFENLGSERSPSQPSTAFRSPLPSPLPQNNQDARPAGPGRMSLDIPRPYPGLYGGNNNGLGITTSPVTEPRRSSATRPVPSFQIAARQISPPLVTVESPKPTLKPAKPPPPSRSPSRSPKPPSGFASNQIYGVSPRSSSSSIPALPPRPTVSSTVSSSENLHAPILSPKVQRSPRFGPIAPPPVNRAGKPSTSGSASGSTTPLMDHLTLDAKPGKEISPFSTPPSSSDSTPNGLTSPLGASESRRSRSVAPNNESRGYFVPLHSPDRPSLRHPEQPPRMFARTPSLPVETSPGDDGSTSTNGVGDRRVNGGPVVKTIIPGRSSPGRLHRIPARPSVDESGAVSERSLPQVDKLTKVNGVLVTASRLAPEAVFTKPPPPAPPAPRRSMDRRRSMDVRPSLDTRTTTEPLVSPVPLAAAFGDMPYTGTEVGPSDFPDASQANRRPPRYPHRPWELGTGYDTRLMTACGEYVCTGGFITRVWNIKTGESITSITHGEGIKVTAMAWKPMKDVNDEGCRLWLGTNTGDILELDIPMRKVVYTRSGAHQRGEIIKIFRHGSDLWSMDDEGKIINWRPTSQDGVAGLDATPIAFPIPRGQSTSIVVGNCLWHATGKDVRVFNLMAQSEQDFNMLRHVLTQEEAGDITCAAKLSSQPNMVYFAHSDGKVSVYDQRDRSLVGLFNVSVYKIHAMTGVGNMLWAGYSTGMTTVYDTSTTPWTVRKNWRAHNEPVCSIVADASSIWKLERFQVVTLGMDNIIRIWDGMLEQDWMEDRMQKRDEEYCTFSEITAAVMTWNAGASKPTALRADQRDSNFFRDYVTSDQPPDILVFGFQELVDLEDKKLTAKSFFKSRKKDVTDNEKMSHQYRAWKDHLVKCLDEYMPASSTYTLLQTADLVGLFSCVFVKTSLRPRIREVDGAQVKRGMGGLHGNKGAIILRMVLDDSSICLVNCHLAAGQTQTMHRNNDITAIMESENLPISNAGLPETFVGGGDGVMILDHEICIVNGDLNYRIDAMTRDAVVRAVRENNLAKLLERDQLHLSRKRNPAFRLKLFQELPITFAPTYKYNVGTDEYDTSEKKRSPAWCDRILFRGLGRIKCTDYRRWEVHASDHRPVTGRFKMRVKSIDPARREMVWQTTMAEYDQFRSEVKVKVKLDYLVNVLGLGQQEAAQLLQ